MIVNDRVYGKKLIEKPVLIELIGTPELQRLDKIHQFGMPDELYNFKGYSRLEHSLGVMFLLRKVGADDMEQIAGLLHDVSHSAFSHLIDWVYGTEMQENHQDEIHNKFVNNSSLPAILKNYGFDLATVTDYHNFPLLEQEAPLLCADRVDYALREMALYQDQENFPFIRDSLIANGRMMFNNREAAELFARNYLSMQLNHWTGLEYMTRWRLFADAIKTAVREKIVAYEDFFSEDFTFLDKLDKSNHQEIISVLALLRGKLKIAEVPEDPQFHLKKKFRWVDPEFVDNGKVYCVTEVNNDYRREIDYHRERNRDGWKVRIIS